jgi:hypothetical protein
MDTAQVMYIDDKRVMCPGKRAVSPLSLGKIAPEHGEPHGMLRLACFLYRFRIQTKGESFLGGVMAGEDHIRKGCTAVIKPLSKKARCQYMSTVRPYGPPLIDPANAWDLQGRSEGQAGDLLICCRPGFLFPVLPGCPGSYEPVSGRSCC